MSTNFAYTSESGARTIDDSAWKASIFSVDGLQSRVLKDDRILDMILHNEDADTIDHLIRMDTNERHHILRLQIALKIVVPQMGGVSNSVATRIMGTETTNEFSTNIPDWILLFQQGFNRTYADEISRAEIPFKRLDETGVLDAATLLFIDRELREIKFYDVDQEKVIHHAGRATWVCEFTVVQKETCGFWTEPLESKLHDSIELELNDRVLIHQILDSGQWCYVELDDGTLGYLKTDLLWTDSAMPDTGATLYRIPEGSGMGLLDIVALHYPLTSEDEELEIDRRFYANLLLYVNNPGGERTKIRKQLNFETGIFDLEDESPVEAALYSTDPAYNWKAYTLLLFASPALFLTMNLAEATWNAYENFISTETGTHRDDWKKARAVGNKFIWIPSKNFAHTLREVVNTGSITGNIKEAFQKFNRASFNRFKPILDEWWPAGTGYRVDVGLGATFVFPAALDGDYYSYIYRDTEGTVGRSAEEKSYRFKLYRRGIVKGGFDAGVGAGLFIGMGGLGKHGKWATGSSSVGIGAGAGAEVFAGPRVLVQEEFTFDLDESTDLAFMLFMCTQNDFFERMNNGLGPGVGFSTSSPGPSMASIILKTFDWMGIDPYDYMTHFKVEGAFEVSGGAAASAGLRFGDSVGKMETAAWGPREDNQMPYQRGNWFAPQIVAQVLSVQLGINFTGDICMGFEMDFPEGFSEEEAYGFRIPNKILATGYFDAELVKTGAIPFAVPIIDWIPNIGGGIKVQTTILPTHVSLLALNGAVFTTSDWKVMLYGKAGEMDFYNHMPASEATLSLDTSLEVQGNTVNFPRTLTDLKNRIEPTFVEKRIPLAQFMTSPKFARFHKYRTQITRLIKHHTKSRDYSTTWGFIGEGWLTFSFSINDAAFSTLAKSIYDDLMNNQGKNLQEASMYLLDILKGVPTPNVPPVLIEQLLSAFDLMYVTLHAEGGIGAAIAGRVGKGELKARIRAYLNLYQVYHVDVTDYFLEFISEVHHQGLAQTVLQSMDPAVQEVLNVNQLPE